MPRQPQGERADAGEEIGNRRGVADMGQHGVGHRLLGRCDRLDEAAGGGQQGRIRRRRFPAGG